MTPETYNIFADLKNVLQSEEAARRMVDAFICVSAALDDTLRNLRGELAQARLDAASNKGHAESYHASMKALEAELLDAYRLLIEADAALRLRPGTPERARSGGVGGGGAYGLCDAIDNAGHPYPSEWASRVLSRAWCAVQENARKQMRTTMRCPRCGHHTSNVFKCATCAPNVPAPVAQGDGHV